MVVTATNMSATARDTMWRFGGVCRLVFWIQVMMIKQLAMAVEIIKREMGMVQMRDKVAGGVASS